MSLFGYDTSDSTDAQKKPVSDIRNRTGVDGCVEGCVGMGSRKAGINPSQNK